MFDRRLLAHFDWTLLGIVLLLCGTGLMALYSATLGNPDMAHYLPRQALWMGLGLGGALTTTLIDYRLWARVGVPLHFASIVLLILVLLVGTGGPGSPVERWIKLGPFFLQPSEFTKFTLVLALAHYFRDSQRIGQLGWPVLLWPALLMAVPLVLILRQPDLGTSLLLLIVFVPMVFLAGLKLQTLLFAGALGLCALPIAWSFVLKPYQRERVLTFLDPERDPLGAGYHIIQSKIAVGSGGLFGKGLGEGTQGQLNFLPAHHTDFIFSVFAEEWGFAGTITVLLLFMALIFWSLGHILNSPDRVSAMLTVGVVTILTSHVLINIGMTIGLMPVVGVPLPFFSYGGSSLLSQMFGIGLLLNVRMRRFRLQDP
jgi:rod shape determining protein RodA